MRFRISHGMTAFECDFNTFCKVKTTRMSAKSNKKYVCIDVQLCPNDDTVYAGVVDIR